MSELAGFKSRTLKSNPDLQSIPFYLKPQTVTGGNDKDLQISFALVSLSTRLDITRLCLRLPKVVYGTRNCGAIVGDIRDITIMGLIVVWFAQGTGNFGVSLCALCSCASKIEGKNQSVLELGVYGGVSTF